MLHRRRRSPLLSASLALALMISFALSSCSSDGNDDAAPGEKIDADATQSGTDDDADTGEAGGGGNATARITIGDETWEFESVNCSFGEETGVENAVFNLAGREGQIILYAADEDGRAYVELSDLDTMDDGGLNWTSTGDVVFEVDGRALSSTLEVATYGDGGSQETETAVFEADCS